MVNWRSTWCKIHWLGWVSFFTLVIGVACFMTAVAIPNFYELIINASGNKYTYYIGLWNICSPDLNILVQGQSPYPVTGFACLPIDNNCNSVNGNLLIAENCSQFHAMQAVLVIACILGALAIFVNWSALSIMLAHGSLSTFVVKMGGFFLSLASGVLGLLMMILTVNEKSSILQGATNVTVNYHASFGVLIVGWLFTIISAVTFTISARRCGGGFHTDANEKGNFTDES